MVALIDPGIGRNPPRYLPSTMSGGEVLALVVAAAAIFFVICFVLGVN